jgi:hypothetical protein
MLKELSGDARIAKAKSLGTQPGVFTLGSSVLGGGDVLAGEDLGDELKRLLFPTADPLTQNQTNDIEHLRAHIRTGGDIFVTLDSDFIAHGRQDALRSIGVWVLRPAEATMLLKEVYGWA